MKIETGTYIEVRNLKLEWAVTLDHCIPEMKPIIPMFIFVYNQISPDFVYVENMLTDTIPEKIIDGVNGGISDDYIEVGFWRIKDKKLW